MTRRRWVQIDGQLVEVTGGSSAGDAGNAPSSPTILADLPDFVSSIDGTVVRGRAGMREHCARHNVVPTADLKGLPPKLFNQNAPLSEQHREATRRTIADIINSKY